MRRVTSLLLMLFVLGAGHGRLAGQKPKPSPDVPVQGEFESTVAQSLEEVVTLESAVFAPRSVSGAVKLDAGFTMNPVAAYSQIFGEDVFVGITSPLQPSGSGTNFTMAVRNVGKVLQGMDLAGQASITWSEVKGDGKQYSYRLQFGDAYVDTIDYVHTRCVEPDATGSACNEWLASTLPTAATPTGEVTVRNTGPRARLTVEVAKGAKGIVTLGILDVPFSLRIRRSIPLP